MTDRTTDDEPAGEARPNIAASSLRALRAARRPAAEPVEETVADEVDAVPVPVVEDDVSPEPVGEDDPAPDPVSEDGAAAPEEPADEPVADDEPPVLAGATRRKTETTPAATRRRPDRLTVVSAGVAVAALVFGVVSGVVWWRAGHADARTTATTRDAVVVDARLAITTVNTSDYRKPSAALSNWLDASTGSLKSQFTDSRASAVKLLAQAKVVTTAVVLDAAVTKLDTGKGSATVIASVNVKRKPVTGAATTTRNRFRATLTRVGDDWKLADLTLVPVGLT